MLDQYFRRPLLWDYLIVAAICTGFFFLIHKGYFSYPPNDAILALASDVNNVSLTSAGFILTLLTILITFKSGSKISSESYSARNTTFELFFASKLYFETVKHLKNCVKSLVFVSALGFALRIGLEETLRKAIFFYNISCLIIIILSLWRCLLILSRIIKMQERS